MVTKFPISSLKATATRFLKKWVDLARPADPTRLYLQKKTGGLGLPAIYQKQQTSITTLFLTSSDPIVQHTAKLAIRREQDINRPIYKPMLEVRDIWQVDPGASRKSLGKTVKVQVTESDSERSLEDARSLPHQGQLLCVTEDKATSILSAAVLNLPPEVLSFSLNAAQDTLPHITLALWRKHDALSDVCKLCGMRQTLPHVLNQCPMSLNLRRYTMSGMMQCWQ